MSLGAEVGGAGKQQGMGQEVSIATNSRQPPPKTLNIYTEQTGWWNTYHTQYLQKERRRKMLGIFAGKMTHFIKVNH